MAPTERSTPEIPLEATADAGFEIFTRARWAGLAQRCGSALSDAEVRQLAATGEPISIQEVVDIYVPLAELLTLIADTKRSAQQRIGAFLGDDRGTVPFIIGIAGGVAVGKSTTARLLQALLGKGDESRPVELLTTDGFLFPNATLESRGIMGRKGFPESYDQRRLIDALGAIRSGDRDVATPVYSHLSYDIVPDEVQIIDRPDILIVEGLNVLQVSTKGASPAPVVVSDFFDLSIYVDAAETDVARWFKERLLALRSVLNEPGSFFHRFASLSDEDVSALAEQVWNQVNLVNLRENIAPTRGRAQLIVEKGSAHLVDRILLRRA
jgi:type I pantothenate kinase